ncbi:MAG: FAD-dependent oxidoreductase [Deltaproteobacteria bacterium]|nr:FAD-dependent oxidoreductase [Deltaproteobacteria bacterium]
MSARERFDVVVAGGGTAGIAAATSAARLGARVLLVERGEALGGNATHALVHTFCGLFLAATADGDAPIHAHHGFPRRFARGLQAAGGARAPERAGKVFVLPIHPDVLERYAVHVCDAAPTLTCWLHAEVTAARLGAGVRDTSVLEVARPDGCVAVESRIVVDTTGDGTVAALGGAAVAMAPADELQCPSFIFRIAGAEPGCAVGFARLQFSVATAGAVKGGALPAGCESVLLRPGAAPDEVYVTLNVARPERFDPLDPEVVATLAAAARASAERLLAHLRDTRPAFRRARLLAWPRRLGIRETRRVEGRAVVTAADVLDGRRRDDEVAVSTWPIELWRDHRRAHFEHPAGPSSIPLDALVSRSHPRLGMAGRCASATHEALGALRVIGTAMATGEAIGVAAALAADADVALAAVTPAAVRAHILAGAEA